MRSWVTILFLRASCSPRAWAYYSSSSCTHTHNHTCTCTQIVLESPFLAPSSSSGIVVYKAMNHRSSWDASFKGPHTYVICSLRVFLCVRKPWGCSRRVIPSGFVGSAPEYLVGWLAVPSTWTMTHTMRACNRSATYALMKNAIHLHSWNALKSRYHSMDINWLLISWSNT